MQGFDFFLDCKAFTVKDILSAVKKVYCIWFGKTSCFEEIHVVNKKDDCLFVQQGI